MMQKKLVAYVALLIVLALSTLNISQAAQTGDSLEVNFKGTFMVDKNGSCTFVDNGPVAIDFGTVVMTSVSGGALQISGDYTQDFNAPLQCDGDFSGVQMRFRSTSGSYETFGGINVLETSTGVVAIELLNNGVPQSMGEYFNFPQPPQNPTLQFRLVQVSTTGNIISGDKFNAAGTLELAFN